MMPFLSRMFATISACGLVLCACSSPRKTDTSTTAAASAAGQAASPASRPRAEETLPQTLSPYDALPAEARALLDKPFTGDLDEMVKRRLVRAGVVFNRTQYFIDKGEQRGISYESIKLFEEELNKRLKTKLLKVHVAIVPLSRDQLFPSLASGKVDFVAAALTITPERKKVADFSNPTRTNVSEVVVTAPGVAPVATAEELSGREVFVRRSSSYYESLQALNKSLTGSGKAPVSIKEAPEALEDDDILEMVNVGLIDVSVVDDFVAEFWSQVFPKVQINKGATVRTGGEIAIGVRKNSPKLLKAANTWIKEYGPKTAFGNTMERRYLQNASYVKDAASEAE